MIGGSFRGIRGGAFDTLSNKLQASSRDIFTPADENYHVGFRVATIPEPSTAVLAILAFGIMWWWRKRLK